MANLYSKQQTLTLLAIALVVFSNQFGQTEALDPLIETGVSAISPDGKHIAVNLPGVFNLALDTRGSHNGVRITESVLSGLIKLDIDRQRNAEGKMEGPIKVTVGGLTMYDSACNKFLNIII